MTRRTCHMLEAKQVNAVLKKHKYRLPQNCEKRQFIANWWFGKYYGYGTKDTWIPLNKNGGMATKAFHDKTVKFPARINKKLLALLDEKDKQIKKIKRLQKTLERMTEP